MDGQNQHACADTRAPGLVSMLETQEEFGFDGPQLCRALSAQVHEDLLNYLRSVLKFFRVLSPRQRGSQTGKQMQGPVLETTASSSTTAMLVTVGSEKEMETSPSTTVKMPTSMPLVWL